jgi:hypothetical protein
MFNVDLLQLFFEKWFFSLLKGISSLHSSCRGYLSALTKLIVGQIHFKSTERDQVFRELEFVEKNNLQDKEGYFAESLQIMRDYPLK